MFSLLVRQASTGSQSKPCELESDPNAFKLCHFPWEMDTELGNLFSSLWLFGKWPQSHLDSKEKLSELKRNCTLIWW